VTSSFGKPPVQHNAIHPRPHLSDTEPEIRPGQIRLSVTWDGAMVRTTDFHGRWDRPKSRGRACRPLAAATQHSGDEPRAAPPMRQRNHWERECGAGG